MNHLAVPGTVRHPGRMRVTLRNLAVTGGAVALGLTGCSSDDGAGPAAPLSAPARGTADAVELTAAGTLAPVGEASNAITYDPELAPPGGQMSVTLIPTDGSTRATLDISGFLPDRGYAVHLHTNECGPTGAAAGPHFQHRVDPAATPEEPSSDPEYANPDNEVWLDVRTDGLGAGTSTTEVPFVFTDRVPGSVVMHEAALTATGPGEAGQAGDRVACLALPKP